MLISVNLHCLLDLFRPEKSNYREFWPLKCHKEKYLPSFTSHFRTYSVLALQTSAYIYLSERSSLIHQSSDQQWREDSLHCTYSSSSSSASPSHQIPRSSIDRQAYSTKSTFMVLCFKCILFLLCLSRKVNIIVSCLFFLWQRLQSKR